MQLRLIDSTLREGRQSLLFDDIRKIQPEYLKIISKMGVRDVEYRNPSISEEELEEFRRLRKGFPELRFHAHFFLSRSNIDFMLSEPSVAHLSTFVPFPLKKESLESLGYLLNHSKKDVRIGVENAPALSAEDLAKIMSLMREKSVVTRVSFSDTLGILAPETTKLFVERVKALDFEGRSIEFHLHNDFGLAAANAVEIMQGMKDFPSTVYMSASMLGLGERNGILSFGDFISNALRLGIGHGLDLGFYGDLIRLMKKNGIEFNRDPLCENSFHHFASSHILKELRSHEYQNIDPHALGLEQKLVFNELTGSDVYDKLAADALKDASLDPGSAKKLVVSEIKKGGSRFLFLDQVIAILKKLSAKKG